MVAGTEGDRAAFLDMKTVLISLTVSQCIATLQVAASNASLLEKMTAVKAAGYLAVPNDDAMSALSTVSAAFFGGWFFCVTLGSAITLLSIGTIRLSERLITGRSKTRILVILWMGIQMFVIVKGSDLFLLAYFLLVPPIVYRLLPEHTNRPMNSSLYRSRLLHLVALIILFGLWLTSQQSTVFVTIRDFLLLPNPIGQKINSFYYRYTLYPAELIKPLNSKTIKTYRFARETEWEKIIPVKKVLLNHDFVPITSDAAADVTIDWQADKLSFRVKQETVLVKEMHLFLSRPTEVLTELSILLDDHDLIRRLVFSGLVLFSPLLLYYGLYRFFASIIAIPGNKRTAEILTPVLLLLVGVSLLYPTLYPEPSDLNQAAVRSLIRSSNWRDRVVALRAVDRQARDIADYEYQLQPDLLQPLPERIWLARVYRYSGDAMVDKYLETLVLDRSINVACQAIESLGERGHKKSIPLLMNLIQSSDHWYVQRYAYRALKKLGWKQGLLTGKTSS